jgi:hypothetical protein
MPLDERERSIIQTARSTPKHLPELYVAGRMFFRFDPIFRRDAELARERAFGDAEPLQLELLTEEQQFDRRRLLRNDRDLVDAAEDLATRWGLDPEDCFHTVAFDSAVNFPIGRVFRREPDSGSAYLELRLYSEYAWAPVRRALAGQPWLIPGSDLAQFPESPARQGGVRLRGIETTIAAKAMALHFLRVGQPQARPTGGHRTWEESARLWDRMAPADRLAVSFDPHLWRRREADLLDLVYDRMLSASRQLLAIKMFGAYELGLWLEFLAIDSATWSDIVACRPIPLSAWRSIAKAIPDRGENLLWIARHDGLVKGER